MWLLSLSGACEGLLFEGELALFELSAERPTWFFCVEAIFAQSSPQRLNPRAAIGRDRNPAWGLVHRMLLGSEAACDELSRVEREIEEFRESP